MPRYTADDDFSIYLILAQRAYVGMDFSRAAQWAEAARRIAISADDDRGAVFALACAKLARLVARLVTG